MAELPDDVHQLEDLLRATEGLLHDWREARRTLEDAVREFAGWLSERERSEKRKRRIGTFAGGDSYTLEDFERARQLRHPVHLFHLRDIDERLRPFLDWRALEKVGQELETFWQSAVETCLSRGGCAEDDVSRIAEQRENVVKQLRDLIVVKRGVAKPVDDANDARHSSDFASVNWFGTPYTFTTNQAACVRVLWEAWKNTTPVMGGVAIIDAAGVDRSDERLDLVFRDNPAWGTMIFSPSKGRYCLKAPDAAT